MTIKNKVRDKEICSKREIREIRIEEVVGSSDKQPLVQLFLIYISGKPTNLNKFANETGAAAAKFECQADKQMVKTQTIQCIIWDNLSQMAASAVSSTDIFSFALL